MGLIYLKRIRQFLLGICTVNNILFIIDDVLQFFFVQILFHSIESNWTKSWITGSNVGGNPGLCHPFVHAADLLHRRRYCLWAHYLCAVKGSDRALQRNSAGDGGSGSFVYRPVFIHAVGRIGCSPNHKRQRTSNALAADGLSFR